MNAKDIREAIAATQHAIWAHWMRYLFSVSTKDDFGNVIIPADKVRRWESQVERSYAQLSIGEQESDRHQADKVIAAIDALAWEAIGVKTWVDENGVIRLR